MHLPHIAAVAAAFTIAAPALAQEGEIERGPREAWVEPSEPLAVPEDASGPMFVRQQDTLVRLEDGVEKTYSGLRVKVLNPSALQLGNLSITWNPNFGSPIVHSIKLYRDGTVIDLTDDAKFEVLRREEQLELAMLTGVLTAVYNIRDLRVGDELEFEATTYSKNPTFGDRDYGLLMLAPQTSPGRFKMQLSWDKGDDPRIRMTPDLDTMTTRTDRSLTLAVDDPPTARAPKDAPPRYQWMRMIEYSDFASWSELSSQFATLYQSASRLRDDSPLVAEAARIAAAYPTEMERASAALKLVQDQVRYVYVGLNAGNLTPADADETWERRYGDCKGKTALLMALLDQLGIPAEAVMVNLTQGADDGFDQRLPNPMLFDHVLVRATIDGEAYWLDGTLPSVATPTREPRGTFRNVLPYRAAGADLERLPWQPSALPDEMALYQIDASAGFDEPAGWTITSVTRGLEALQFYSAFSSISRAQYESEVSNSWLANGTLDEVDSATWRFDKPTGAMVMTVSGKGPLDWDEERRGGYSLVLPGGGFSPPARRSRPSDQDQALPYYSQPAFDCYVTTVTLPTGTTEDDWSYNSQYLQSLFGAQYGRRFELRPTSISMVRSYRGGGVEISAEAAERDNARIDDFDNSKAIIEFEPPVEYAFDQAPPVLVIPASPRSDDKDAPKGNVPPASDPVWLGENAPCLPDGR